MRRPLCFCVITPFSQHYLNRERFASRRRGSTCGTFTCTVRKPRLGSETPHLERCPPRWSRRTGPKPLAGRPDHPQGPCGGGALFPLVHVLKRTYGSRSAPPDSISNSTDTTLCILKGPFTALKMPIRSEWKLAREGMYLARVYPPKSRDLGGPRRSLAVAPPLSLTDAC